MNDLMIWICQENIKIFCNQLAKGEFGSDDKIISELLENERSILKELLQQRSLGRTSGRTF